VLTLWAFTTVALAWSSYQEEVSMSAVSYWWQMLREAKNFQWSWFYCETCGKCLGMANVAVQVKAKCEKCDKCTKKEK
jgi:hypothetical protein